VELCWFQAGIRGPVFHVSLIAPARHRLLSLRCVSFPAPQSQVTEGTSNVRLGSEGLVQHAVDCCVVFVDSHTGARTNTIEATWKNIKAYLRMTFKALKDLTVASTCVLEVGCLHKKVSHEY
jgi:hypothetical protein